jgi:group I intron endonuclease
MSSFKARWKNHRSDLRCRRHSNSILQAAWDKYGEENMIFEVLIRCEKRECLVLEQILLDTMCPEYNIARSASAPMMGRTHSEETLCKMAEARVGRVYPKQSPAAKERSRISHTGKRHSPETKEKCRIASTGVTRAPFSEEHCRNISAAKKGKKPKPFTAEHLANMSKAQLGRTHTAETKEKCRIANTGRPVSAKECSRRSAYAKTRTGVNNPNSRPVVCVETGEVFVSAVDAAKWASIGREKQASPSNIRKCCAGNDRYESSYGYHWKYPDQPTVDNTPAAL